VTEVTKKKLYPTQTLLEYLKKAKLKVLQPAKKGRL